MDESEPSTSFERDFGDASTSAGTSEPKISFNWEKTYLDVKDKPLSVDKVIIQGLERTKSYLVARELEPLQQARSLEEIKDVMVEAHEALTSLNVFDGVEVIITDSNTGNEETCTVLVNCAEKSRMRLHAGSYVSGVEGSVELSIVLSNNLGLAEDLSVSVDVGSKSSTEFAIGFTKPRLYGKPVNTTVTLHQQNRSYQSYTSYSEQLRGVSAMLFSADGTHAVEYELDWLHEHDIDRKASMAVRQQAGHHLKSALSYIYRYHSMDDTTYPTSGIRLRSRTEFAGLGPDPNLLRYVKQHIKAQWVTSLIGSTVFSLTGEAGVMLPWGPGWAAQQTPLSDRFHIGGVHNSLRGFHFKGAGPSAVRRREKDTDPVEVDFLGGDLFCSLLAQLRFRLPVPAMEAAGMYGHLFANAANSVLLTGAQQRRLGEPSAAAAVQRGSIEEGLQEFKRTWRWSAGIGLVWPTTFGRLEVNLVKVLRHQPSDKFNPFGLQVGFTASI